MSVTISVFWSIQAGIKNLVKVLTFFIYSIVQLQQNIRPKGKLKICSSLACSHLKSSAVK